MDMFEQMRWALVLGNLAHELQGEEQIKTLTAEDVLLLSTSKAADHLGLSRTCGRLAPGLRADVIVVDRSMTAFLPPAEAYRDIVYNCSAKDVVHVIVDGQLVVRSRQLTAGDEQALVEEATERAARWFSEGRSMLVALGLLTRCGETPPDD
jgi:5-methylthioadenosine/S-adenosylhomocysteine deaminase